MGLQSFPVPGKLYFRQGCLPVALREVVDVYHARRVLVVTDEELLRSGKLSPVTNVLHELGLAYAVNSREDAYDCAVFCGGSDVWQYLPGNKPCIIIPTSFEGMDAEPWLCADMVILDEDLISDSALLPMQKRQILDTARHSLKGENASDYTLAWAVQAMRLIWNGGDLLHAAALSCLADAAASPESGDTDLLPDAAQALGITPEELTTRIESAIESRHSQ